uniref:Uncharacterized protein n=1 Tax=Manihot esculenta TaxID=3983 RepID=A0A2C9UWD9_MANES
MAPSPTFYPSKYTTQQISKRGEGGIANQPKKKQTRDKDLPPCDQTRSLYPNKRSLCIKKKLIYRARTLTQRSRHVLDQKYQSQKRSKQCFLRLQENLTAHLVQLRKSKDKFHRSI